MISEAVHIDQVPNESTLNSKSEWTYVKLPKATVPKNKNNRIYKTLFAEIHKITTNV